MTTTTTTTAATTTAAHVVSTAKNSSQRTQAVNFKAMAAAAAAHVAQVHEANEGAAAIRERVATATEAALLAILKAAGKVSTKAEYIDAARTAYMSLDAWPENEEGAKVGEAKAGEAGAAYIRLRNMVNDQYKDDMTKRSKAELKVHRSERAKSAKANKEAAKKEEIAAAMLKAGVVPFSDVTAAQAFDMFIRWYDSIPAAVKAFGEMATAAADKAKAAADNAAAKVVGKRAAAAAAAAAPLQAEAAKRSKKAARHDKARQLVDKAAKVSDNLALLAGRRASKTIKAAETAESIAADTARIETSNAATAAETLK